MSGQDDKATQSMSINAGGNVSDIVQAKGNVTQVKGNQGPVGAANQAQAEALLQDLRGMLATEEGRAAFGALKEELDKADTEEKVDEFKLAGVIDRIVQLVPAATGKLVSLFAPGFFGELAKGAAKAALDRLKA